MTDEETRNLVFYGFSKSRVLELGGTVSAYKRAQTYVKRELEIADTKVYDTLKRGLHTQTVSDFKNILIKSKV